VCSSPKIDNLEISNFYTVSFSLSTVRVTFTLSAEVEVLDPLVANITITINTTAPKTQAQGSIYQVFSEVVAVEVVVVTAEVVSCAMAITERNNEAKNIESFNE
jgi:hypothetical protein